MKLLARIKQLNKSNAGLTLVEIIVTMLILVVIALPILSGFVVAARANAMSKELAYAREAAENVIEVANGGGLSEEVLDKVGDCSLTEGDKKSGIFTYTIENIEAGTGTYTAEVICNRTTYEEANKYVLPDMDTLDAEETVVIFPESNFYKFNADDTVDTSADIHRFDSTAINDFYQVYHDGVLEIYGSIVEAYLEELEFVEKENETIEKGNEALETPLPTLALPEEPPYPEIRGKESSGGGILPIKDFLSRTIDIKVEYGKSQETGTVQATVYTKYVYEMRGEIANSLEELIQLSFKDYYAEREENEPPELKDNYNYIHSYYEIGMENAISNLVEKLKEPKEYTVAAETTVDTLENLYLIVNAFNITDAVGSVLDYNTLALTVVLKPEVGNDYLNGKSVNVFLVIQDEPEKSPVELVSEEVPTEPEVTLDGFNLELNEDGLSNPFFIIYSQMAFFSKESEITQHVNKQLYLNRDKSSGTVLYDVTVKVYNPDNMGKELTEIKTTISSKE